MKTTLFADDACLSFGHDSPQYIENHVNLELEKVRKWMNNNKLSLNINKTNFVLFHKKKQPVNISITYNGNKLVRKNEIKYLGVFIDQKLNFSSHINYCLKKLNKCIWAICKLRKYTTPKTLKLLYYSIAYPFLQYCVSTWGGTAKSLLKPLLTKQKIIARLILNQPYRSPSSPLFHALKILKLDDIYQLQICRLMHKHHRENIVVSHGLTNLSDLHSHNTRSHQNNNYYLPAVRTNLGKTSFSFNGPKIWNALPPEIRNFSNYGFKDKLKNYFIGNYSRI